MKQYWVKYESHNGEVYTVKVWAWSKGDAARQVVAKEIYNVQKIDQ